MIFYLLTDSEIKDVIDFKDFKSDEHMFARDVWVLLYRLNGANFADLLRMRWSHLDGDYIFFTRKKTESTRRNNKKLITVPLTDKLKDSISLVGDKDSLFLSGKLKEGYDEETFKNRNHKIKQQINRSLKDIRNQLKLSRPLQLGTARDCYASTLDRNNTPREKTSQMLGHSNVVITEHYLDGMNPDSTFGINAPNTFVGFNADPLTLRIGQSANLQAEIVVGDETCDGIIKYASRDPDIVTVDEIGNVTGVANGIGVVNAWVEDAPYIYGNINITVGESDLVDIVLVVESTGWTGPWMGFDVEYHEYIGLRDISTEVVSALEQRFDNYQFGLVLYGADPSIADCAADIYWYPEWAPYLEPRTYYNWIPLTSTPSIIIDGLNSIRLICQQPPEWGDHGVTPYSAVLNAISNLYWRAESEKIIILFQHGAVNALHPANEAELVSGLTPYDVIDAAVENQIILFTISINNFNTAGPIIAAQLSGMSQATGGEFYNGLPLWPMQNILETVFDGILNKIDTE